MKTRQIPAILMLIAGLITCIFSFFGQVGIVKFLINMCVILVIFFVLGEIIRYIIDKNFADNEENGEILDEEKEQVEQETGSKEKKE